LHTSHKTTRHRTKDNGSVEQAASVACVLEDEDTEEEVAVKDAETLTIHFGRVWNEMQSSLPTKTDARRKHNVLGKICYLSYQPTFIDVGVNSLQLVSILSQLCRVCSPVESGGNFQHALK